MKHTVRLLLGVFGAVLFTKSKSIPQWTLDRWGEQNSSLRKAVPWGICFGLFFLVFGIVTIVYAKSMVVQPLGTIAFLCAAAGLLVNFINCHNFVDRFQDGLKMLEYEDLEVENEKRMMYFAQKHLYKLSETCTLAEVASQSNPYAKERVEAQENFEDAYELFRDLGWVQDYKSKNYFFEAPQI